MLILMHWKVLEMKYHVLAILSLSLVLGARCSRPTAKHLKNDVNAGIAGIEDESVAALQEGTYFGYILPASSTFKIPTTLDIIKSNETTPTPGYRVHRAILKATLGGFDALEYTVQDYVIYTHKHFTLERSFDSNKHNVITLHEATVAPDGTRITGTIESPFVGLLGAKVELIHRGAKFSDEFKSELNSVGAERSVVPSISGEYEGKCGGTYKRLQLMAVRRGRHNGQLLSGFVIRGVHGTKSITGAAAAVSSARNTNAQFGGDLQNVTYNYFTNRISIPEMARTCQFDQRGHLQCGQENSCKLFRKSYRLDYGKRLPMFPNSVISQYNEMSLDHAVNTPSPGESELTADTGTEKNAKGMSGEYIYGGGIHYHHRKLGERVFANVAINNYIDTSTHEHRRYMTFKGKILVGNAEFDASPYIELTFNPVRLSDADSAERLVFVGDAFVMIVNSYSDKGMKAELIAKDFGRLGSIGIEKLDQPSDFIKFKCSTDPIQGAYSAHEINQWNEYEDYTIALDLSPSGTNSTEGLSSFSGLFNFDLSGRYNKTRYQNVTNVSGDTMSTSSGVLLSDKTFLDPFTRAFSGVFTDGTYVHGVFVQSGFEGFISEPRGSQNDVEEMQSYKYKRAQLQ